MKGYEVLFLGERRMFDSVFKVWDGVLPYGKSAVIQVPIRAVFKYELQYKLFPARQKEFGQEFCR